MININDFIFDTLRKMDEEDSFSLPVFLPPYIALFSYTTTDDLHLDRLKTLYLSDGTEISLDDLNGKENPLLSPRFSSSEMKKRGQKYIEELGKVVEGNEGMEELKLRFLTAVNGDADLYFLVCPEFMRRIGITRQD